MLDQLDEEQKPKQGAASRSLKRRSTDAVVAKAISDNFKGFTAQQAHATVRNGQTLVERLATDKRKQRGDPNFSMGLYYYKRLRQEYLSAQDPAALLHVQDQNQEVGKELLAALVALKGASAKRQPMIDWLASSDACNQKELVGILRMALEQRTSVNERSANFCMGILRYIVRTRLHEENAGDINVMRSWADNTLVQSYMVMKRSGVTLKTWWGLNSDVAALVVPRAEAPLVLPPPSRLVPPPPPLSLPAHPPLTP